MDWVEFQQCLVRRLQSADLWDPVAPFRDTGYYAGNSVSNPRPYILVGVGAADRPPYWGVRTGSGSSWGSMCRLNL